MKCPHCGFVSFEYLQGCKKCSKDLSAHKSQYGIDYLEPVSLEMYSYAAGGGAAVAVAHGGDDSARFGADDFAVDNESDSASMVDVEIADEADHLSFGEGTDDISIDFGGDDAGGPVGLADEAPEASLETADEISLDLGEADSSDEISLDLGEADSSDEISLDLGEADSSNEISLDLGEADSSDEISLDLGESEAAVAHEGSDEISLDFGDALDGDSGFSLDLGEDMGDDTKGGALDEELSLTLDDEPAVAAAPAEEEDAIEISLDDADLGEPDRTTAINRGDVEAIADEVADDDFADIELSLEDEDLFGGERKGNAPLLDDEVDGLGLDTNLDLGDLSLEIGDDELGFDFDDPDTKV